MAIQRIGGLSLDGALRFGGLPLAGASRVAGLGPLPGLVPVPEEISTPYAYWPFVDGLVDLVSAIPIISYNGSAPEGIPWGTSPTGGFFDGRAMADETNYAFPHRMTLAPSRTAIAASVWLYSDGGESPFKTFSLHALNNAWSVLYASSSGFTQGWHHYFSYRTTSWERLWRDNEIVFSFFGEMVFPGDTFQCTLSQNAMISELAMWESPGWSEAQAAGIAAALYNDGLGTVYRDDQWWEVAAP